MKILRKDIIPTVSFIAALSCIFFRNPISYWGTFAICLIVSIINIYYDRKLAHIAIYVIGNIIFLTVLILYS